MLRDAICFFLYVQFNFCNKNNSYFYLAKFKRGQNQTSVIFIAY